MWLVLALVTVLLMPTSASAWLKVCNNTDTRVNVAIAYASKGAPGVSTSHTSVIIEGWWVFTPGECAQVKGDLNTRDHWIYYYAHNRHGKSWGGSSMLCVTTKEFKLQDGFGRDRCPAPGYRLEGFGRADAEKPNHTLNFR